MRLREAGPKYLSVAFMIGAAVTRIERDEQERAWRPMVGATEQTTTLPRRDFTALALGVRSCLRRHRYQPALYVEDRGRMGGRRRNADAALGMLSLTVWTLLITTSIKYVAILMRADNDGEGGILALMSLLGIRHGERPAVIAIGILGAALLYGDGAITPAISVLSALAWISTEANRPNGKIA
jgi:K+ potassium transporter